jgi:hypothetical protein
MTEAFWDLMRQRVRGTREREIEEYVALEFRGETAASAIRRLVPPERREVRGPGRPKGEGSPVREPPAGDPNALPSP